MLFTQSGTANATLNEVLKDQFTVPANVPAQLRNAWLQQAKAYALACGTGSVQDPCRIESIHALILLIVLCCTIVMIICAFAFFREDKEEQITPLCPQLVVKDLEQHFRLPFESQADNMTVTGHDGKSLCKVVLDWPDPFRPGASGVAATVRLQNSLDLTLATVVARNVAVVGQGLALCRAGCEIFGFVEPEGPRRYYVRHRTGVHLLTLEGDFENLDIIGKNPVNSKVCWFKKVGDECHGRVLQHVDAGLVICSFLATHVHRRLTMAAPPPSMYPPALQDKHYAANAGLPPRPPMSQQPSTPAWKRDDTTQDRDPLFRGLSPDRNGDAGDADGGSVSSAGNHCEAPTKALPTACGAAKFGGRGEPAATFSGSEKAMEKAGTASI